MDRKQLHQSTEWLAAGSIEHVRDQLVGVARQRGGRVGDLEAGGFEATFGSRLAYRLGGAVLKSARDRLPMKARLSLAQTDDMVQVKVTVWEDPGWNVASLSWRKGPYASAMDRLLADLQHASDRPAAVDER